MLGSFREKGLLFGVIRPMPRAINPKASNTIQSRMYEMTTFQEMPSRSAPTDIGLEEPAILW
jgi:hypothetical protein